MLLTRCPSCNTTFRITVALLRQASGQVRCGRCNHVFPAVAHLEEVPNEPDAQVAASHAPRADEFSEPVTEPPASLADDLDETAEHEVLTFPEADTELHPAGEQADDELEGMFESDLSATGEISSETQAMENRALAAPINPDESPDFELPPDIWRTLLESEALTDAADDGRHAKAVASEQETDTGEASWPEEGQEAAAATAERQPPAEWLDAQPAPDAEALEDDLAQTGPYRAPASDAEATDTDWPADTEAHWAEDTGDDWTGAIAQDLVAETDEDWPGKPAEQSAAETEEGPAEAGHKEQAEDSDDDWTAAMAQDLVAETDEDWPGKPAEQSAAETDEGAAEAGHEERAEDTGDDWAAANAQDLVAETHDDRPGEPAEQSAAETEEAFAGESESDQSAPSDDDVTDLEQTRAEAEAAETRPWAGAASATGSPDVRRRRWRMAVASLATLLMLQLAYHYRNALASQALLGPVVRAVYGTLGIGLAPNWDVEQYQINDWAATAGPDQNGQGRLTIRATLLNRGPRSQPHPYIRLELKDRWDERVGSRVFKPGEYLPRAPGPGELMAAGARVAAQLTVVDPGEDAYGFELDVCVPSGANRLRCANDNVF